MREMELKIQHNESSEEEESGQDMPIDSANIGTTNSNVEIKSYRLVFDFFNGMPQPNGAMRWRHTVKKFFTLGSGEKELSEDGSEVFE